MLEKVREIIADVTKNQQDKITETSNSSNVDGWDSVAQINIIVTIEAEFGVSFRPEELHSLNSVSSIMEALRLQTAAA